MSMIIKKATSPEVLDAVWRKSRNDNAIWQPGISRKEMERKFVFYMFTLVQDIRSGVYKPDPVRSFLVNKGDGGTRLITALTLRDKIAQRAILSAIETLDEKLFHSESYAYRPHRSIDMVITRIRYFLNTGYSWVLMTDILQCFDNIPCKKLLKLCRKMIHDKKVNKLFEQWIGMPQSIVKKYFIQKRGIPQGAVISPFLCNLYLTPLDTALSINRINFVRYADNILIMTHSREEACNGHSYLASQLSRLGLKLNSEKTRLLRSREGINFLGRSVTS